MRAHFATAFGLSLLAACGGNAIFLGFPPAEDAASLVIATPVDDEIDLVALDLDGAADFRVDLDTNRQMGRTTFALTFLSPLSAYRAKEGVLERPRADAPSIPLLGTDDALFGDAPDRVFAARVYEAQGAVDWESVDEVPAWVAQARVSVPAPQCPVFVPAEGSVSVDGFVAYAFAIDERAALVRIFAGDTFVVTADGATAVSSPGPKSFSAAYLERADRVWLGDDDGRIWTARPNLDTLLDDFVEVGDTTLAAPIESIAVAGDTVFAVSYRGDVALFDGSSWRRVARLGRDRRADIVSTGPGEAMILAADQPGVHVVDASGARFDDVRGVSPQSIADVPGFGVVIGTEAGGFYRRDGSTWKPIEGATQGFWSASMLPYDGGFVFHLASGVGGYHHPTLDDCDDLFATGLLVESRLVPQGRDILVVHLTSDAERTVLTRLVRR